MDKSLLSGSNTMLLLQLLKDQDMYGYQMIEELRKRSQDVFEMKVGTLYPLLHSLEKSGFLQSYEGEAAGKKRIYYQITKDGRQELERKKGEWAEYARAVMHVMQLQLD